MRSPGVLLLGAVAILAHPSVGGAQQVIYVVRHAEPMPDGTMDPSLSTAGQARADALKATLKDAGIQAIYTSDLRRTQQTAKPLADHLMLSPEAFSGSPEELAKRLRADHVKDRVLVVGHSNTVPLLLKEYGHDPAPPVVIAPGEFDNLFVVVPKGDDPASVSRLRYRP